MHDRTEQNVLISILTVLYHNPGMQAYLPKYYDNRRFSKGATITAMRDERERTSPLADLFEKLVPFMELAKAEAKVTTDEKKEKK